jgi:hypothetical protein
MNDDIGKAPESHGEDSGAPIYSPESLTAGGATGPLRESPRASVGLLEAMRLSAPCYIIGPEVFQRATKALLGSSKKRTEANRSGMVWVSGLDPLFRDEEARAWFIYQSLFGLSLPLANINNPTRSNAQRRRLAQDFRGGWADGSLRFLSGVPMGDLEYYRGRIGGFG